ncbi:MAG: phosphodiester glycosidase family protein [Clostridia bacterium]|nr:phosphodiester glycosidase family protein [Clostridia bacterium]
MKSFVRIFSVLLCAIMIAAALSTAVFAVNQPTGMDKSATEEIKVDGQGTGVNLTQFSLTSGSVYANSTSGLLNVIEIDPSNTNVSIKVLNCGDYTWSKNTMGNAAVKYNEATGNGTVIAAMNGDPWIVYHTDYDGDGEAATGPAVKHVSVSRGLMIKNGEIWATAQISDENYLAKKDNVERGTGASNQPIFGVKKDGTAVIGCPNIQIKIKNTTTSGQTNAAGINRLPAPNSTILYNQRCGTESFAFEDAYEIYVKCNKTAFGIGQTVTGTVTHIFESGDTAERPAIDAQTVVISARGNAIKQQKGKYSVGDKISISCNVSTDKMYLSKAADWNDVVEATGGFYTLIEKGVHKGQELTTNYPCTIVGVKEDGTIMLISTTTQADGSRAACQMKNMQELVDELGCYTAIMFDGGGSTQMVTLEGNQYVRRCSVSDGTNSVRSVISGLAVVYNNANLSPENHDTYGIKFLDGLGLQSTYGEPEAPDPSAPHIQAGPSYAYYYVGDVSYINGKGVDGTDEAYIDLVGMRDPNYNSSWSAEQKAEAIQPAILDGSTLTLGEDYMLTISGYAFANGSQKKILYSLDQQNWFEVQGGTYSDASSELTQTVMANGWIKSASAGHAVFENVGVDLSEYQGQTVTVSFAVTPGADDKALHFLTIENLAVPAPAPSTEEETDPPAEETTEAKTEPDVSEQVTTSAPVTEAPTEQVTEPSRGGCQSAVFGGVAVIACITLGAVLIKKRED